MIDDLLVKYAPVIYMHSKEKNMPSSVEWFIDRCRLVSLVDGTVLAETASQDAIAEHKTDSMLVMKDKAYYNGEYTVLSSLNRTPMYVHYKIVENVRGEVVGWEINYFQFYPYNSSILGIGDHEGDWEHLTVRVNAQTRDLEGVRYSNHTQAEGMWVPADRVPLTSEGQIVAYAAIGGHGLWPTPGIQLRAFIVGSDWTNNTGLMWRPETLILMDRTATGAPERARTELEFQQSCVIQGCPMSSVRVVRAVDDKWLLYKGGWGDSESLPVRGWFNGAEPATSCSTWQRVFRTWK
jgi:hypothetical protein